MPPKSKVKEQVKPVEGFFSVPTCQLPLWDDDQILSESWGTALGAAGGSTAGKDPKAPKGGKDAGSSSGNCFIDHEGRASLEKFIEKFLPLEEAASAPAGDAADRSSPTAEDKKNKEKKKSEKKEKGETPTSSVAWRRPTDVSKPFRPVVHRNATPYLDPYAQGDALAPLDAKEEEAKYRNEMAQAATNGKKGEMQKVESGGLIFQVYPETVSLMADLVGHSASHWQEVSSAEAIRRYREIPALMEPYDPTLVSSCAETPAEACGSRYSTALRHKLQQAETLEALRRIPPFLMSAFNSALLVIETVQELLSPGRYLWELIYPHAPGTCHPVYNPYGKYVVKLFVEGSFRKVTVDDGLPVDELGRPLITVTSLRELWPAILVKAVFKALGADAVRLFANDPELLISCFTGNCVPQYIQGRSEMLNVATLLLTYNMQLENRSTPPRVPSARPTSSRGEREERTPSLSKTGESAAAQPRKRSLSKRSVKKEVSVSSGLEKLVAEEFEAPNDDEPIDKRPRILCCLRTSPADPPQPGFGSGVQLFAIVKVLKFRNTLAVLVQTTPRTDLVAGIFDHEREDKEVQNILLSHSASSQSSKEKTVTSVWLTLEELVQEMDCIVVWTFFDKRYLHQVSMEYDPSLVLPAANGPSAGKKGAAVPASAVQVVRAPKKSVSSWLSFTSDRPEEVAVVVYAPLPPPPPVGQEEEAVAQEQTKKPQAAKQSGKKAAVQVADTAAPTLESTTELNVDSAMTVGCPSSWANPEAAAKEVKYVQFEYYQYHLSEPLTQSIAPLYEYGKLSNTVFRLRPGTHLFHVTVPEMEFGEKVSFVSDARMELKTELSEALKAIQIHHISDAGVYPPIDLPNNESLWFKRKLRVSTDTVVSIVLTSLLPSENPAAHRNVNISALSKAVKNAGVPAGPRGVGGKGGPPTTLAEELDQRRCDIPIVKYASIILINLDNREDTLVGEGGSLIHVPLTPNKNGYLLIAYACVPTADVKAIREATEPPKVPEKTKAEVMLDAEDSALEPPIYGRGLWKVSLRSDQELTAFEALTHNAHQTTDINTMERGGGGTFFRQSCTVTEPTHVSLVAEMIEQFNIPITFTIRHSHSAPLAPTKATEVVEVPETSTAPLYRSDEKLKHLFIPDVLLELADKSKSSTYIIEGTIQAEKAEAWDEYCRKAQEDKFHAVRLETEKASREHREKDIEEAAANTSGFIQQKMEEQQSQLLQQQTAQEADRASREGAPQKRTRSLDRRKPQSQGHRNSRNSISHDTSQKLSVVASSSHLNVLDTVDKDLNISHNVQIILSSSKVELRNTLPQEDSLALFRQHWKEAGSPAQSTDATRQNSAPQQVNAKAAVPASSKTTRQQQQQREQAAAEEQQRSEQGRQSRLQFIENPQNVLIPYIQMMEEAMGRSHPKGGAQPVVVSEDTEENNFAHSPPFTEDEFSVKLLPIRAYEFSPPIAVEPPLSVPNSASATVQTTRENRRSRAGAPKSSTPPNSQWNPANPPQWEEDESHTARGPLIQITERLTDLCREKREDQKRNRKELKKKIYQFWTNHPSVAEEGAPTGVYPSLIGNRDDDTVVVKRGKGAA